MTANEMLEVIGRGTIANSDFEDIQDSLGKLTHWVMFQTSDRSLVTMFCNEDDFNSLIGYGEEAKE